MEWKYQSQIFKTNRRFLFFITLFFLHVSKIHETFGIMKPQLTIKWRDREERRAEAGVPSDKDNSEINFNGEKKWKSGNLLSKYQFHSFWTSNKSLYNFHKSYKIAGIGKRSFEVSKLHNLCYNLHFCAIPIFLNIKTWWSLSAFNCTGERITSLISY